VHGVAELMNVIRDLCRLAAAYEVVGLRDQVEALTEQSAELLAYRARLLKRLETLRAAVTIPEAKLIEVALRGGAWTN
jgi:hypothetical protein